MNGVIYTIRNLRNGKFYVGSTKRPVKRKSDHWRTLRGNCHSNKHLQAAWNTYGEDAFVFAIEEEVPDDADLLEAENVWLREHVGKANCYNIARDATAPMLGAFGALNPMWGKTFSHTASAREKISENSWMKTEEGRAWKAAQFSAGMHPLTTRERTPEERAKIAASLKLIYQNVENHPRYRTHHTDETKAKISANRKGKHAGENHYRYGQTVSEEVRKKIGDTQRGVPKAPGRKASEEGRAKIRAAAEAGHYSHWKGKQHTMESRLKMSKPIYCSGNDKIYNSITEAREDLGMTPPTITRALKSGKPLAKGKFKGWVFRYVEK